MHALAENTQRVSWKVARASKAHDCHRIDIEECCYGLGSDERFHFKRRQSLAAVTVLPMSPISPVWGFGFLAAVGQTSGFGTRFTARSRGLARLSLGKRGG